MKSATVDGNDVEAVMAVAREAAEYVGRERKPFLLETYTYRLRGHLEPDDQAYVDKHELAKWKAKDPVTTLEMQLLENGIRGLEIEAIRSKVREQVEEAAEFALTSPYPDFAELTTDVYA